MKAYVFKGSGLGSDGRPNPFTIPGVIEITKDGHPRYYKDGTPKRIVVDDLIKRLYNVSANKYDIGFCDVWLAKYKGVLSTRGYSYNDNDIIFACYDPNKLLAFYDRTGQIRLKDSLWHIVEKYKIKGFEIKEID